MKAQAKLIIFTAAAVLAAGICGGFDRESSSLYAGGFNSNNSTSNNATFVPGVVLLLDSSSNATNASNGLTDVLSRWDGNGVVFEENGDRFQVRNAAPSAPGLGLEGDRALYAAGAAATIALDSPAGMTFKGIWLRQAQGVLGPVSLTLRDASGAVLVTKTVKLGPEWTHVFFDGAMSGVSSVEIEANGQGILIDALGYIS